MLIVTRSDFFTKTFFYKNGGEYLYSVYKDYK